MTVKLIRCYIENFGGLSHVSQEFGEGLTVVKALNGLGKTTLAEFIRAMFYGFPHSGRALERNSRRKYTPWQGGRYGGNLTFRYEGELYRVERFFGEAPRQDTFALYQGESGVPCGKFSPRLGEELFRLDSDSFLRSVYLPQLREGGALSTAGIQTRLSNLMEDTDDLHNFEKAMEALRRKRSALVSYRGDGGSVRQAQSRITALQKELDSLEETPAKLELAQARERELNGRLAELQKRQDSLREREALAVGQSVREELEERRRRTAAELDALQKAYPGGLPPEREAAQLSSLLDQMALLRVPEPLTPAEAAAQAALREGAARFAAGVPTREELLAAREWCDEYLAGESQWRQCRLTPEETDRLAQLEKQLCAGGAETSSAAGRGRGRTTALLLAAAFSAEAGGALLALARPAPGSAMLILAAALAAAAVLLRSRRPGRREADDLAALRGEHQALTARRRALEERAAALEERLETLSRKLSDFLAPYDREDAPGDFAAALEELRQASDAYRHASERMEQQAERQERRMAELRALTLQVEEFTRTWRLPRPMTCSEDARALRDDARRQAELKVRLREETAAAEDFAREHPQTMEESGEAGEPPERLRAEQEALRTKERAAERELASVRAEAERLNRQRERLTLLRDELAQWQDRKAEELERCRLLDKTMELLQQARDTMNGTYLGTIRQRFSHYMSLLMEEGEDAVFLDGQLQVRLARHGAARELGYFSAGQADLVMLCLRLARVDALFPDGDAFLILDDPFVNLDDGRVRTALDLLKRLGETRQILYLTCSASRVP